VGLAWSAEGICRLQLPHFDGISTRQRLLKGLVGSVEGHPPEWLETGVVQLQRYFTGKPVDFSGVPVDFGKAKNFHRLVYAQTRLIGWGKTTTYGELAAEIGSTGAAQSVGTAMARNPVPIIVPCHRVLASGNKLGGFSAPGGVRSKLALLEMEGVRLDRRNPAQQSFDF
jgi:methylated-DNA-[protein]-cysteine S-methyltransferase